MFACQNTDADEGHLPI